MFSQVSLIFPVQSLCQGDTDDENRNSYFRHNENIKFEYLLSSYLNITLQIFTFLTMKMKTLYLNTCFHYNENITIVTIKYHIRIFIFFVMGKLYYFNTYFHHTQNVIFQFILSSQMNVSLLSQKIYHIQILVFVTMTISHLNAYFHNETYNI